MSMQKETGHEQPPTKDPGRNLTQGAGHVDLVDGNAPPNIDTGIIRPCTVSLDRQNVTEFQQKQQISKFNIKPCTVHLQHCLSKNIVNIQACVRSNYHTCPILKTKSKFMSSHQQRTPSFNF